MPKKKKLKEEKKEIENVDQLEEEHEEESGLEEELLNDNFQFEFDDAKLRDLITQKSTAPVLGQVAVASETRPTGRFIFKDDEEEIKRSSDPFKYIPGESAAEEQKYMGTNASVDASFETPDILKMGRRPSPHPQEFSAGGRFSEASQMGLQSFSREKYQTSEKVEMGKVGRESPLDKEKSKYEFKESGR